MRFSRVGLALGLAAALVAAAAQPARAVPVEIDVSITFQPNAFPAASLSGAPLFFAVSAPGGPFIHTTQIIPGNPVVPLPPNIFSGDTATEAFILTDSCLGDGGCGLAFGFTGTTDTQFPVNVSATDDLTNAQPLPPSIIPVGAMDFSLPLPPPIRAGGFLVGFDDPEIIGTITVTLRVAEVPEPATLGLLGAALLGAGLLGLGLRFRRRRAA